jgi:hypothetical protein
MGDRDLRLRACACDLRPAPATCACDLRLRPATCDLSQTVIVVTVSNGADA